MITPHGETYEPDLRLWMQWATMVCDYCDTAIDGEAGEINQALELGGWTRWVGGLCVCPDCRQRMTLPA